MNVLGEVVDYDALTALMRVRAAELQITYEALDEIAGTTKGHASKILSPMPSKRLGATSMTLFLPALAMKLIAVVDDEALRNINRRGLRRHAGAAMHAGTVHWKITRRELRRRQKLGGLNSRKFIPKSRSRALAKKAAKKRWRQLGRN